MLTWLKRILVTLAVGSAIGFVIWSIIGKSLTSALFSSLGGTFSCQGDVEAALSKFVAMQLYSALGGGVLAIVASLLYRRRASKRASPALPSP